MKPFPFPLSAPMSRSVLLGRKTQSRRVIVFPKAQVEGVRVVSVMGFAPLRDEPPTVLHWRVEYENAVGDRIVRELRCPYRVGQRLYVREPWRVGTETRTGGAPMLEYGADGVRVGMEHFTKEQQEYFGDVWAADPAAAAPPGKYHDDELRWHAARFMPKFASRTTLEVARVGAERVQSISEADAVAEGSCVRHDFGAHDGARTCFRNTWDGLNAGRGYGWASNPWVWAITFPPPLQVAKKEEGPR